MDSNNNMDNNIENEIEETAQTEKKGLFSKKPKEKKTPVREVFDWVEIIALSLAFVLLTFSYIARQARVDGSSMRETFHHGESIVISNLFYTPKQGDVIVFQVPNSPLTTEAMVVQRAAHQAEVQKALVELREARMSAKRRDERRELTYKGICALLGENSAMEVHQLAEQLSLGMGMTYRILAEMKKRGMICQEKYGGAWCLSRK